MTSQSDNPPSQQKKEKGRCQAIIDIFIKTIIFIIIIIIHIV